MLNGLDLFSGIGGLTLALAGYCSPVAYCENDRYAQAVLLSRMREATIPYAPIWDDIKTLKGSMLPPIDIIYGGFPCQDISCAGRGAGLEGKRSGLFFEIVRLVDELQPGFIFLENVPAILTRGLGTVTAEITKRGYDCRWTIISAAEVGAPHLRKRWWLLANAKRDGRRQGADDGSAGSEATERTNPERICSVGELADAPSDGLQSSEIASNADGGAASGKRKSDIGRSGEFHSWWESEPDVGRVANGVPLRTHRIRGLGNAVVPQCAREAFERLCGLS